MKFVYGTLLLLCFATSVHGAVRGVRVDTATSTWRDASNRVLLWHGINFVEKSAPYYPVIDDDTIDTMVDMGLNVVRLGVMVTGLFPTSDGSVNFDYLKKIEEIIDRLWQKAGIVTIIDLHQDVLSPVLCGEGVPNWMVPVANLSSMDFPRPLTLAGSKPNSLNNSWMPPVKCSPAGLLKFIGWSEFYMTDACGKAFQQLYDGTGIVGEMIARYWNETSRYFADHPAVLAYEILNEPWYGDYIKNPALILESGKAEKETVGPFMERMHGIIRSNDAKTPVLYAPAELNNRFMRHVGYERGFLEGEPMAFHVYCITGTDGDGPTSPFDIDICHFNDDFQLDHRASDLKRLATAGFITEFGAVSDKPTGIAEVRFVAKHMDKIHVSWAFWDHNLVFGDPTYERELSRPYPRAIAGSVKDFTFDPETTDLTLAFLSSEDGSRDSELWLGAGFYSNGTNVQVSPAGCCNVTHGDEGRSLHIASPHGVVVEVKVSSSA